MVKLHRLTIEARTKAFFIPHVSGMCLTSNISKLCNNLFKALPLTKCLFIFVIIKHSNQLKITHL